MTCTAKEVVTLAELRLRSGRSQAEIAKRLGTTQSGVSRIERQADTRISTLAEYVAHVGGRLRLIVERRDGDLELIVPALRPTEPRGSRRARIVWQDERSRSFHVIGTLDFDGQVFRFRYKPGAADIPGFAALSEFPSFDRNYESADLFDLFARRIPRAADPSFHSVIEALGLSKRDATPAELMAYPLWDPSDTIQVVPEPEVDDAGTTIGTFLVSGVRYADAESNGLAAKVIERLRPGDALVVDPESTNPANADALAVSADGVRLGYVPNYLLPDIKALHDQGRQVRWLVEHANDATADWHLRLLARFESPTPTEE